MIMTKTVGELCKQIKGIYNLNGSADTVITGISSDSRQIEAGYLFVCISGVHVDGATFADVHDFVWFFCFEISI